MLCRQIWPLLFYDLWWNLLKNGKKTTQCGKIWEISKNFNNTKVVYYYIGHFTLVKFCYSGKFDPYCFTIYDEICLKMAKKTTQWGKIWEISKNFNNTKVVYYYFAHFRLIKFWCAGKFDPYCCVIYVEICQKLHKIGKKGNTMG